jgi:hypothetical protein
MSDQPQKKPGAGAKILAWVIIIAVIAGVWQCTTGGGSSGSSSNSTANEAVENIKHSPAAHVSSRAEALNFVVGLRAKGIDQRGVDTSIGLLRAAGLNNAADLIDQANREIGD